MLDNTVPQIEGEIVIPIERRPKNLKELIAALAIAEGTDPSGLLVQCGLPKGKAKAMASGDVLYPDVVSKIAKKYAITPTQWFKLITATPAPPATTDAGSALGRGGRRKAA